MSEAAYSWDPTATGPTCGHALWDETPALKCRRIPGHGGAHVYVAAPGDTCSEPVGHGGHR